MTTLTTVERTKLREIILEIITASDTKGSKASEIYEQARNTLHEGVTHRDIDNIVQALRRDDKIKSIGHRWVVTDLIECPHCLGSGMVHAPKQQTSGEQGNGED